MSTPFEGLGTRTPSLIERMGGVEAASGLLIPAVELFYAKLVSDPYLAKFFEGIDTSLLMRKQVEFMAFIFGGPAEYKGKDIAEAHEHLIRDKGLNETHFDVVANHFRDTLTEMQAASELIDEAVAILLTARPVFETSTRTKTAAERAASEELAAVSTQLQALLDSRDKELAETRMAVSKLIEHTKPQTVERMRSALRMRSVGLASLFDQALAEQAAGGTENKCPYSHTGDGAGI